MRGCSVFTRPPSSAGCPVTSSTERASMPSDKSAARVPSVAMSSQPISDSPRANATRPSRSDTERRARAGALLPLRRDARPQRRPSRVHVLVSPAAAGGSVGARAAAPFVLSAEEAASPVERLVRGTVRDREVPIAPFASQNAALHRIDVRHPRPLLEPPGELLELALFALGDDLDRAVVTIPHTPGEAPRLGLADGVRAEVHALHEPSHNEPDALDLGRVLHGLAFRFASIASSGNVFATGAFVAQPRRVFATANSIQSSSPVACASEFSTSVTPASIAFRTQMSGRSRRSGPPFTSSHVPVSRAPAMTALRSTA